MKVLGALVVFSVIVVQAAPRTFGANMRYDY